MGVKVNNSFPERKPTMLSSNELYITGLKIRWDSIEEGSYLRKIEAIKDISEMRFHSPVTFFVGENGSGKSTLLEAISIAYGFNPEGGTKNYSFSTFDSHSELCDALTLIRDCRKAQWSYFLRAESFYNVASAEEEYSKIQGVPQHYHEKSHGESFLSVVQENFTEKGLYILDEPEAALSPQRQLTLLLEMSSCVNNNSQFIVVTHSPILLGLPKAEILSFDDGAIKRISYEETQSYQITKMFINNRERMLKLLLEE